MSINMPNSIERTQDELASEMHDLANKNKIVMLIWTPEDVKELLDDAEMTTEDAQHILLAAAEDIHELLWNSAKRYFEKEHNT